MTRFEELVQKLINGETIDNWECNSRLEECLLACINKSGVANLGEPRSKMEELLHVFAEQLSSNIMPDGTNDTTDATATASDILGGKTAYAGGLKIIGTYNLAEYILRNHAAYANSMFKNKDEFSSQLSAIETEDRIIIGYSTTAQVDFASYAFYGLTTLTNLPKLEIKSGRDSNAAYYMREIFRNCSNLETIDIIAQNKLDARNMFDGCSKLKEIITTGLTIYYGQNMFYNCSNLETIEGDISTLGYAYCNYYRMFYGCKKLKNVTFTAVYSSLDTIGYGDGTGTNDYGTELTIDSLLSFIRAIQVTGKKFTIGTANINKLANIYVDENGYQVASSTTDAMLALDYATFIKGCSLT